MRTTACILAATLTILALAASPARAEPTDPLRLLPESTVAVVTIEQPAPVLNALLTPEYYQPLGALKPIAKALKDPGVAKLPHIIGLLEMRLGTPWQDALRQLTAGGVTLAFDAEQKAAVLIVKSKDAELLNRLNQTLVDLIEGHAASEGRPSPVKSQQYQGVTGWSFGKGEQHAIIGNTLIATNKGEALKAVLDSNADSSSSGLAGKTWFQQARHNAKAGDLAWAAVDLTALRQAPPLAKALDRKTPNPNVEILFGGILDALRTAPYAAASLKLKDNQLTLDATLPRDASQIASSRRWWFASSASEGAPALLVPKQAIANLAGYRDLAGMWQAREELFDESTNARLTQADTNLGLYFSGRDFGPEVLGKLTPHWQIVVARREFSASQPIPALKLPAFAVVLETKDDAFADELFLAFQNIVGIINLQGIQTGRPQLLLGAEQYHGATIRKASYLPSRDAPKDKARMEYNFDPAAARVGSRFIIGSTCDLVRELVDVAQKSSGSAGSGENTVLAVDGQQLRQAFADDRDLLVSRAMLSSGDSRQAAEKQVDGLLTLGKLLEGLQLQLLAKPQALELEATLTLGDAVSSTAGGE